MIPSTNQVLLHRCNHGARRWFGTLPPVPSRPPPRRVVVTGVGIVSPLGVGREHVWSRLCAGHSGVTALTPDGTNVRLAHIHPSRVVARVPRGDAVHEFSMSRAVKKEHSRTQNVDFIAFALQAAAEALQHAAGGQILYPVDRFGVCVGTGVAAVQEIGAVHELLSAHRYTADEAGADAAATGNYRKISPFFVPRMLPNMAGAAVAMIHGLRGPTHSASTACATSAHAIGDAYRFIKYGDADAMLAGGSEACVNDIALAGFSRPKALSVGRNDTPAAASRPFDVGRDGFVLGEGAGMLMLEELNAARARGALILAEIRGYGACGDAYHITTPREDGSGAIACMTRALDEGGLTPAHVDYVNAHATSTPTGDGIEAMGIGRLFGSSMTPRAAPSKYSQQEVQRSTRVAVTSTKGAVGHLLGAAGAVEAIFSVLAVHHGVIPPTINLDVPDPELPTDVCDFVAHKAVSRSVDAALSNSFGFGGTNCSLLFTKVVE